MKEINVELVELREDDRVDKIRQVAIARDRILQLQSELALLTEWKIAAVTSGSKQDKLMKDLTDENERLKQKMKNSRLKRKATEAAEQICKVCQRLYVELENFNWSCRTHYGEFSGEMWWCCGKPGREALGCRLARHVSKEDEDLKPQDSTDPSSDLLCSSCKALGHRTSDCPKDPNIRSKQDLGNELRRIHDIREHKKLAQASATWHDAAISLFKAKYGEKGFGKEAGSEGHSSESEEEEWEKMLKKGKKKKIPKKLVKFDTLAEVS